MLSRFAALLCACLSLALLPLLPACAQEYTVTDMGAISTTNPTSHGTGLSPNGQYVTGDANTNDYNRHMFKWTPSSGISLVYPSTANYGFGVNDAGHIAGRTDSSGYYACYWNGSTLRLLSSGGAYCINSHDTVGGQGYLSATAQYQALWYNPSPGTNFYLGLLCASTDYRDTSCAYAVNDYGKMVGSSAYVPYASSGQNKQHAFLWTPTASNGHSGSMLDIHPGSYTESFAKAINDNDEVTGYCWNSYGEDNKRAFYRSASGSVQMLPGLTGTYADPGSEATGINNSGLIVGSIGYLSDRGSGSCFAAKWVNGQMQLLSESVDLRSPWRLDEASAVNNNGYIVGTGKINGYSHAYLLTPIANPTTSPAPHIDSVSPTTVHAGSVLHVYGSGFTTGSVVSSAQTSWIYPKRLTTTYVSPTQLDAVIPNATVTSVWVLNPRPGGGESNHVGVTTVPNHSPVAVNDSATTRSNTAMDIDVLANDSDPDGDTITVITTGKSPGGTDGKTSLGGTVSVAVVGGKTIVHYVPPAVAFGTDQFVYRMADSGGYTASATVTVTIDDGSPPPMAMPDSASCLIDDNVTINVLANDTGADANDHITLAGNVGTAHGGMAYVQTWSGDGSQTMLYNPPPGYLGTDTFTYTINNSHGKSASALVTVQVVEHFPPVAVNDTAQTCLTTPVNIDVLANDSDPDPSATLSVSGVGTPSNGTSSVVTVEGKQYAQYTPAAGFSGTDTFTYTLADSFNGSVAGTATGTVTVTVLNDNAPVAGPDSAMCLMNQCVWIDVLANDTDADPGDTKAVVSGSVATSNGGWAYVGGGGQSILYCPGQDFVGTDTFHYTIADSQGGTATGTVTIQVVEHLPPVAVNDSAQTSINAPVNIDVLANDSDPDWNATFSISGVGAPSNGGSASIVDVGGGQRIQYQPPIGFAGTDTFTYSMIDSWGGTATATVTVDVTNNPPTAVDDSARGCLNTAVDIDVLANDSDPDPSDVISIASVGTPSNGTASITKGADRQHISYEPAAGFIGTDTFTYTITDRGGLTSAASVAVEVINDQPPVAVNDSAVCLVNQFCDIDVLANDSDPDPGDTISLVEDIIPTANGGTAHHGWSGDQNWYFYIAPQDFVGTDTFEYTIADSQGVTSRATVTVQVVEHMPPVAVDDSAQTFKGAPVNIDVLANDSDPDPSATLSISSMGTPANGTASVVEIDGLQYAQYQPTVGFSGTDTFTYTIADSYGGTATATVTVVVLNDTPPVAQGDSVFCVLNQCRDIDVLGNDTDPDSGDTISIVSGSMGTSAGGWAWPTGDGQTQWFFYCPPQGFTGTDTFEYTIADSLGATSTATVTIEVVEHLPPIAVNDSAVTLPGTAATIDVLANDRDPDPNATISISSVGAPTGGVRTAAIAVGTTSIVTVAGKQYVEYTPLAGFTGTDTFTYTVANSYGATATATVTVTVGTDGNPLVAAPDFAYCLPNGYIPIRVLDNDSQPDPGDTITIVSGDARTTQGSIAWLLTDGNGVPNCFAYSPPQGFLGTDTFVYTIANGQGATSIGLVTVEVVEHLPPTAVSDSVVTLPNVSATIDALANDSDPDYATISISDVGKPANGGVASIITVAGRQYLEYQPPTDFSGTDAFDYTIANSYGVTATARVTVTVGTNGNPLVAAPDSAMCLLDGSVEIHVRDNDSQPDSGDTISVISGNAATTQGGIAWQFNYGYTETFLYCPPQGFTGTDTFVYTIGNGQGATSTALVTVEVMEHLPPVAISETASTNAGASLWLYVNAHDYNPYPLNSLTLTEVSTPANGTVTMYPEQGTLLRYDPNPGFMGVDSFTYTVQNGCGLTASATVTVNVGDNPPVATADSAFTLANQSATIDVLANDYDADPGDPITIASASVATAQGGSAVLQTDSETGKQTMLYTPPQDFLGTDTFDYTIADSHGATSIATVTIGVVDAWLPPVAVDDSYTISMGQMLWVNPLANDSNPTSAVLWISSISAPAHGTAGAYTWLAYWPDPGFVGTDTFTYTVMNDRGLTATATVTVHVVSPNQPPVAVKDSAKCLIDQTVDVDVLANDSDPDAGDTISITGVGTPTNGTASIVDADGKRQIRYQPLTGFTGTDTFDYTIADSQGATSTATVAVVVGRGLQITSCSLNQVKAAIGDRMRLTVSVQDDLGDILGVTADGVGMQQTSPGQWETEIVAGKALGASQVTVEATATMGQTANSTVDYTVCPVYAIIARSLVDPIVPMVADHTLFALCGKVTKIDDSSFWIDDGSRPVKVICSYGAHGLSDGDMVRARGNYQAQSADPCLNVADSAHITKP